jgi:predicted Holliday junction resolvase-like endonuclease
METLSFAFGMLAMLAVIFVAVLVVGVVKVYRHQKKINQLEEQVSMYHNEALATCDRIIEKLDLMIAEVERNSEDKFDETHKQIDDLHRYVDSRIDKTIDVLQGNINSMNKN